MGAVPQWKGRLASVSPQRSFEGNTVPITSPSGKPGPRRFARVPTHAVGVVEDRRRAPRAALSLPLRLLRIANEAEPYPVTLVTRNISSSGIYFLAPRIISPGTAIELEVALLDRPQGQGRSRCVPQRISCDAMRWTCPGGTDTPPALTISRCVATTWCPYGDATRSVARHKPLNPNRETDPFRLRPYVPRVFSGPLSLSTSVGRGRCSIGTCRRCRDIRLEIGGVNDQPERQFLILVVFEKIIRTRIGRQPIFFLEVLAVGLKHGKRQGGAVSLQFTDEFSVTFDDGEIVVVDPNDALEKPFFAAQHLCLDLKNLGSELVEFFLAGVDEAIAGDFLGGQREQRHGR